MKTVQLYTQIKIKNGFRGAQVKTWDYYNFINSHLYYKAYISFNSLSIWSKDVLWSKKKIEGLGEHCKDPDIYLFKGGNDWIKYDEENKRNLSTPIISPVLNYRILDSSHQSNKLLNKRAIRVCPNPDLAKKIRDNKLTNGPVLCIPHGIEINNITSKPLNLKKIDLLIISNKNPNLGKGIYKYLSENLRIKIKLLDTYLSHDEFLRQISNSKICLHLPKGKESFYLPGLESMSLGAITIMPNCQGNLYYTKHGINSFICNYRINDIYKMIYYVLSLNFSTMEKISLLGIEQSMKFTLKAEEEQWHDLLDNLNYMWESNKKLK